MEQIHMQVLLDSQLAAILRTKKVKRWPIDHLIKLALMCTYLFHVLPMHISIHVQ